MAMGPRPRYRSNLKERFWRVYWLPARGAASASRRASTAAQGAPECLGACASGAGGGGGGVPNRRPGLCPGRDRDVREGAHCTRRAGGGSARSARGPRPAHWGAPLEAEVEKKKLPEGPSSGGGWRQGEVETPGAPLGPARGPRGGPRAAPRLARRRPVARPGDRGERVAEEFIGGRVACPSHDERRQAEEPEGDGRERGGRRAGRRRLGQLHGPVGGVAKGRPRRQGGPQRT